MHHHQAFFFTSVLLTSPVFAADNQPPPRPDSISALDLSTITFTDEVSPPSSASSSSSSRIISPTRKLIELFCHHSRDHDDCTGKKKQKSAPPSLRTQPSQAHDPWAKDDGETNKQPELSRRKKLTSNASLPSSPTRADSEDGSQKHGSFMRALTRALSPRGHHHVPNKELALDFSHVQRTREIFHTDGYGIYEPHLDLANIGDKQFAVLQTLDSFAARKNFLRESENFAEVHARLRTYWLPLVALHLSPRLEAREAFAEELALWRDFVSCPQQIPKGRERVSSKVMAYEALTKGGAPKVNLSSRQASMDSYVIFLETHIVPIVEQSASEARIFFRRIYETLVFHDGITKEERSEVQEIVLNNFFLYIVQPVIQRMRFRNAEFSDTEIVYLEQKAIAELELKRYPDDASPVAKAFHVYLRKKMESEAVAKALAQEGRLIETDLVRTLQKTFQVESKDTYTDVRLAIEPIKKRLIKALIN